MKERITIQIDREVADTIKGIYPDVSYTRALRLLLESKDHLKTSIDIPPTNVASIQDIKELKDKFSAVLENLISKNNLKV